MMKTRLAARLVPLGAALPLLLLSAPAAGAAADTQRSAREAYLQCATLALGRRPSRTSDARKAATAAVDQCTTEKLALVGQFAVANPGARNLDLLAGQARQQAIDDLSDWIVSMEALLVERGR